MGCTEYTESILYYHTCMICVSNSQDVPDGVKMQVNGSLKLLRAIAVTCVSVMVIEDTRGPPEPDAIYQWDYCVEWCNCRHTG